MEIFIKRQYREIKVSFHVSSDKSLRLRDSRDSADSRDTSQNSKNLRSGKSFGHVTLRFTVRRAKVAIENCLDFHIILYF